MRHLIPGKSQLNSLGTKRTITLDRTTLRPTTILVILGSVMVFLSYSSYGGENQTVDAQATSTTTSAGGDVNVLYAGSLIAVMETKIGPAFSHLGYNYKGEGHGSIQDANMIILVIPLLQVTTSKPAAHSKMEL